VFVLAEVCVSEARVAEHEELHNHAQRESVGLLGVVRALLVDFGRCVHARAADVVTAFVFNLSCETLVRQSDNLELVKQDVFGFKVVVRHSVFLEPEQSVYDLTQNDADADLSESVCVVEVVEEFALADVLHLQVGLTVQFEPGPCVVNAGVRVVGEHADQVVVQSAVSHGNFVSVHAFLAVGHFVYVFLEQFDGLFLVSLSMFSEECRGIVSIS